MQSTHHCWGKQASMHAIMGVLSPAMKRQRPWTWQPRVKHACHQAQPLILTYPVAACWLPNNHMSNPHLNCSQVKLLVLAIAFVLAHGGTASNHRDCLALLSSLGFLTCVWHRAFGWWRFRLAFTIACKAAIIKFVLKVSWSRLPIHTWYASTKRLTWGQQDTSWSTCSWAAMLAKADMWDKSLDGACFAGIFNHDVALRLTGLGWRVGWTLIGLFPLLCVIQLALVAPVCGNDAHSIQSGLLQIFLLQDLEPGSHYLIKSLNEAITCISACKVGCCATCNAKQLSKTPFLDLTTCVEVNSPHHSASSSHPKSTCCNLLA